MSTANTHRSIIRTLKNIEHFRGSQYTRIHMETGEIKLSLCVSKSRIVDSIEDIRTPLSIVSIISDNSTTMDTSCAVFLCNTSSADPVT